MSRRLQIEQAVSNTDIFEDIDIKDVLKESKVGWLKTLLIAALWPTLKKILSARLNPKLVAIIEQVLQGL